MFDDDDDGVEAQVQAVDEYYFEVTEDEPVCFSILPFQFDENDEVGDCHSEKKVYLRGHRETDKSHLVHKKVVAWRVGLDCEWPNISVLSSEGDWIKLLNPWKPYKDKIARSILITVQMLHFVRKHHREKRRSLRGRLWDHLNEVFDKLHTKPAMDDVRKHHPLIKLLLERDPTLMKLKFSLSLGLLAFFCSMLVSAALLILHRFIEDTTKTTKKPRTSGTQVQLTDSDDNNNGSDYDGTDSDYDEDDDNDDDSDYDEDDGNDDDSDYDEDDGNDDDNNNNGSDYNDHDDNYSEDDNSDVDTNNDDSTDELCALCDDGGNLLSCIGQCKRSFHPTKKDGRESECKTLGYTPAQLKEIGSYLCNNCKYKQHQCFKCGELEPSAEPNAKVFKCKNQSCGHFYHPKCVAKLLEPDNSDGDESCELAQRIMEGMPFTCPVHWCFKCRRMEDRTQRAMQLAACRLCPKSYHRECLPREISFETKGRNIKQRAWEVSEIVIIYCLDHKIWEATGSAKRDHIKFPQAPSASEISDRAEKKGKMANKPKRSIGQFSTKSTKVLNRSPREKIKHTQNSSEHMQTEPSMVGAASLSEQKVRKGQKRPSGSSLPSAVGCKTKKRKSSRPKKEISTRTPCNIDTNCVDHSVQIVDRLPLRLQPSDTQDNLLENPPVDKVTELNKVSKIPEDEDGIWKEQSSEHLGEENAANKDTSHENDEQNDAPDKPFGDIQAEVDQSNLKSRAEKLVENVTGSIPGQEKEIRQEKVISVGENQMRQSTCEQESRSNNGKNTRNENAKSGSGNGGMTPHHVDNPPEKLIHVPLVDKMTITDRIHPQPEHGFDENRVVNGGHTFHGEPNNSQYNVNPEAMGMHTSGKRLRKRRRLKKKATVGNGTYLVENKRCDLGDGKEAHCDMQAEIEQTKLKSGAETSMELGGNANGYDRQEKISMGENQMRHCTCEQESRSDNEKIARNESTKSGFGSGGGTPCHVDNPPEKLMHVPCVDKMTITDRMHILPEYDCDEKQEVNGGHTFVDEQINSQCSVDPEVMGIDTSEEKSIKRRKLKKKTTVGNNTDLVENKRCNQGDEKEAHIQAEVDQTKLESRAETSMESGENANRHDSIPGLEKDISMGENQMRRNTCEQESRSDKGKIARNESTKSGSGIGVTSDHVDDNPPEKLIHVSHVDKMTITDTMRTQPEYDGDGTDLDESKRCNQGDGKEAHCDDSSYQCPPNDKEPDCQEHKFENSGCNDENRASGVSEYKSRQCAGPSKINNGTTGRNSREIQRHHSANGQSKPYPATNYQLMHEQCYHVNHPSNGNFGPSHVPLQPVLPPAYFDANRLHNSYSYPRGLEHDNTGWQCPQFHPGNPNTNAWQYPPYYPARPGHVGYVQNVNNLPIFGYDGRDNFVYGGYYARGIDPAALQHNNGAYQPHTYVSMEGRGFRSNYTLGLGPQPPAAGSVTERYAPRLELTNNWPRR
ncbi:hypothetical protein U9M48_041139 [Paspalum notatum var. saurae]|uniref:Zinc finger PHD-type domain-containing protein n=1 Tax=Paspalum notatum var. saurae TaxID=547442 RepID=A0AAQ3XG85_PASNO